MAGACARIPEPGRGSVSRGPELAAGRYDIRCLPGCTRSPASGPGSRQRDFSAGAGRCEQDIRLVNRVRAAQSMLKLPCGLHFCGSAERCSCCSLQPIPCCPRPLPSRLIESHSTLPPIRIASELKGPEAVVIDTSQPGFLRHCSRTGRSPYPSPLQLGCGRCCATAAASLSEQSDASDGSPAISTRVRETLAQLGPGVSDQAGSSTRPVGLASEPRRNFAQTRSEKRRRSARHPSFDTTLEWCDSLSHGQGSCR